MELINQMIQQVINGFDIAYCFAVNTLTYFLITTISAVINKQIGRGWKRVILIFSIIIIGIAYRTWGTIDGKVLINSAILAPLSWSWIFKPTLRKFGYDYKDIDKTINSYGQSKD